MSNGPTVDEAFDRVSDQVHKRIKEQLGNKKMYLVYSAYDFDENGDPVDNLDKVALEGTVRFYNRPSGDPRGKNYFSEPVTDPTWLQVAVLANEMIKTTRFFSHKFLEGVRKGTHGNLAYFSMGS